MTIDTSVAIHVTALISLLSGRCTHLEIVCNGTE